MRSTVIALVALVLAGSPAIARADDSVAGAWKANVGDGVTIDMNVAPDGQWQSTTAKGGDTVAQMAGTYRQKVRSSTSGNLTFIPSKAEVTKQHGAATIEYDSYTLSKDGQVMHLTASGDTMEFRKQTP